MKRKTSEFADKWLEDRFGKRRILSVYEAAEYVAAIVNYEMILPNQATPADASAADLYVRCYGGNMRYRVIGRQFPRIVCLCGSTRFTEQMLVKQWELTKARCVVLSWCALPDWYFESEDKAHIGDQEGVKEIVDEVHKRKIDLADDVFVLNIGGYIGDSTRSEIEYAERIGKPVEYEEPPNKSLHLTPNDRRK